MALIFCEGFDDGLTFLGKWNSFTGVTVGAPYGRNNSGLRFTDESHFATRVFTAAQEHATMTVGFAFRRVGSANNLERSFLSLNSDNGVTAHVVLTLYDDGSNRIRVNRGTTVLATLTTSLLANQWYYIELKATLHDTTGAIEVRLNGQTLYQTTNIDTKNGGTKTVFDSISVSSGVLNGESHMDDLYVCNGAGSTNNTFLGDLAIETLYPDGNGNSSLMTGSDGNQVDNYQLVDEAAPSTADYVVGASVGNKDTYAFGSLVRTTGPVKGVMVSSYANKTDSAARSVRNVARSGVTEASGPTNALATTWIPYSNVFETDPNTSTDWTIASVNAAEFGVEVDS